MPIGWLAKNRGKLTPPGCRRTYAKQRSNLADFPAAGDYQDKDAVMEI